MCVSDTMMELYLNTTSAWSPKHPCCHDHQASYLPYLQVNSTCTHKHTRTRTHTHAHAHAHVRLDTHFLSLGLMRGLSTSLPISASSWARREDLTKGVQRNKILHFLLWSVLAWPVVPASARFGPESEALSSASPRRSGQTGTVSSSGSATKLESVCRGRETGERWTPSGSTCR